MNISTTNPTITAHENNVFVPTLCLRCGDLVDPGDIYFVRDNNRGDYICWECAAELAPDVFNAAIEKV
jgi:hypothetical protein